MKLSDLVIANKFCPIGCWAVFVSVKRHLKSEQHTCVSDHRTDFLCFGRSLFVSLRFFHIHYIHLIESCIRGEWSFVVGGEQMRLILFYWTYSEICVSDTEYQSARLSTSTRKSGWQRKLIFREKKWNLKSYFHFNLKLLNSSHQNMNHMDVQHPMNSIINTEEI